MSILMEYIPLITFFAVFKLVDIYWATASLIAISALQLAYHYLKHKTVKNQHIAFFVIALVFGTMTILFRDDTFIKWKVTIVNLVLAGGLLISIKFFNKNPLKAMLGKDIDLPEPIWNKLVFGWAAFFTFCAGLNLVVAYQFSQAFWVNFKVFGLLGLTLLFAIVSMAMVYPYLPKEHDKKSESDDSET